MPKAELMTWYEKSDLYVQTSLEEGFCMTALDAVLYQLPLIGFRTGAIPEFIEEGKGILRAQANWLQANPEFTAVIQGQADEQGTREYNLALGARRANSAKEFLVSQGVSDSRLRVLTYGKERPIAVCSEESCYARNRRAVTVLAAGSSS